MPMKPRKGESQSDFMSRCVPEMVNSGHDQDQAVAACVNMFRGKERSDDDLVYRYATAEVSDDLEYVISDRSVDRHGTIFDPSGWLLDNFRKNPVALYNHDRNFVIGGWSNIRIEGGKLKGKLKLLPAGVSPRLDEIRAAVDAGVLRGVSIGARLLDVDTTGKVPRFTKQELVEASLTPVPSNSNALQVARSLSLSPEGQSLVFGEQATKDKGEAERDLTGKHAAKNISSGKSKMSTIAQRIEDAQTKLVALKDQLTTLVNDSGDEPDEASITARDELTKQIETQQRNLDSLQAAERQLASTSQVQEHEPEQRAIVPVSGKRPFAVPAKKVAPADHVIRSLVASVVGHATKTNPRQVLAERYGEDGKIDDATKAVFDVVTRSASAPADTTTSGWASQLVQTSVSDFMGLLMPASVYPGLAAKGLRLNFGRSGVISIPSRVSTPTIAGSFVAQGAPIPVRQGAFTSITLTPKKMAVISTFTREIAEHSTPAIEGLIRNAIQEDTSVALDTVLLDATAASTTRPAGLRNSVSVTTATTGGGFAALVGDLKALIGALITASNGNVRDPVWIMNPIQALSISVTQNAGGDFPFAQEISQNRFQGYPVILSATVTASMVILVDAADFVSVEGDAPRFDMSDQATLHMEDTTPLAIGTAGSPNTVAAPVRSLYQTDSMALRMIMDVNWAMRRTGVIAWTQSVTW